ncbi:MAG TPA: hypothetical protein VJV74_10830 [Terriglobia bacterium]|nr:hypothetical protein [Terriglobia bacterium]
MKPFLCILVIVFASIAAEGASKALSVKLAIDGSAYRITDGVTIRASLTNVGEEPLTIYKPLMWGYLGGLVLEIMDSSRHKVEPAQYDDDLLIPSTLADSASFIDVLPGHSLKVIRRDKAKNLFGKPGNYVVRVKYRSPVSNKYFAKSPHWSTEDGWIESVPVSVKIK